MAKKAKSSQPSDDVFKVSQSKVKTWLRCRRAYHYRYVEKLKRIKKGRPLQFGSILHDLLEVRARGGDPFEKLDSIELEKGKFFAVEREMYGELLTDISYIMQDYIAHWSDKKNNNFYKPIPIDGKFAEHEFTVEIEPGLIVTGKVDEFGQTPDKLKWLVEHKSFNRRPSEEFRWINLQSSIYIRMGEILKWPSVDGTLWDYVHSKPPAMPQLLKGGKLSQKSIYTLPSAVKDFCSQQKIKWKEYPALMKHAESNRSEYFFRIKNPLSAKVVDAIYEDFLDAARDMRDNHGIKSMRTIDKHCEWCDYAPLCKAELLGHDTKFIKKREYERNEKPDEKAREVQSDD